MEIFLQVTVMAPNLVFFVEHRSAAESIAEVDGRVTAPDANPVKFYLLFWKT